MTNVVITPNSKHIEAFHKSTQPVRIIAGPVGSGKTYACCYEILKHAFSMPPALSDKVRRSRVAVARTTYGAMYSSTSKTWELVMNAINPEWAMLRSMPNTNGLSMRIAYIREKLGDGTSVYCEVQFIAFEDPNDVMKLKGTEFSLFWFNEASTIDQTVFQWAGGRLRYPSEASIASDKRKDIYRGIIGDTNTDFGETHFLYKMRAVAQNAQNNGEDCDIFYIDQPPAAFELKDCSNEYLDRVDKAGYKRMRSLSGKEWVVNLDADNLNNLPKDYYARLLSTTFDDTIYSQVCARYIENFHGTPVYPDYTPSIHGVGRRKIEGDYIYIGIDFGNNMAATFAIKNMKIGSWHFFYEIYRENTNIFEFATAMVDYIMRVILPLNIPIEGYGDPAGGASDSRLQHGTTGYSILNAQLHSVGLTVHKAMMTNDWQKRKNAIAGLLQKINRGEPTLSVDTQACPMLHAGLQGGYRYKKLQHNASAAISPMPEKNAYSHVVESAQYGIIGGSGYSDIIYGNKKDKQNYVPMYTMSDMDAALGITTSNNY